MFLGFKKDVKSYKIRDPKNKKTILNKDVTFDEASMMKPKRSQQVKSEITEISQQVESDATLSTPRSSLSFEIPPTRTRDENHVAHEDI